MRLFIVHITGTACTHTTAPTRYSLRLYPQRDGQAELTMGDMVTYQHGFVHPSIRANRVETSLIESDSLLRSKTANKSVRHV